MIVALLASFHTHLHAATLLTVPMLAAIRTRRDPDPMVNFVVLWIFGPTFAAAFDGILEHCAWILFALMAGLHTALVAGLSGGRGSGPPCGPPDESAERQPCAAMPRADAADGLREPRAAMDRATRRRGRGLLATLAPGLVAPRATEETEAGTVADDRRPHPRPGPRRGEAG
jgi:hypothetical protein